MPLSVPVAVLLGVAVFLAIGWFTRPREETYYGQTLENQSEAGPDGGADARTLTPGTRLFAICFLSVWLVGWTFGVDMVIRDWVELAWGGREFFFASLWLAIGVPGWFFVTWTLFRLVRGDHVDISFDRDGDGD